MQLSHRFLLLLVLLAAFWLRAANLATLPDGLHRDEARKIERAWRLVNGYGLPLYFEDIPEPFDILLRSGFLSAAGVMPFTARLFTVFINVLAVAGTADAARALYRSHPHREIIAIIAAVTLAAMPASVVIGRGIYRANWIPLTSMLALAALAWGWHTGKRRYFAAAGAFTALTMMFYLGGVAFPLALGVILGGLVVRRQTLKRPAAEKPSPLKGLRNTLFERRIAVLIIAFVITMLPWLYLYITIPGWLDQRTVEASTRSINPLEDPAGFVRQVGYALQPIYLPDTYFEPRFNTFTDAFLNPALVLVAAAGLAASLWRWRRGLALAVVVVGAVMLFPAALSSEPTRPIRLIGIFGPLALLAGLGMGEFFSFINHFQTIYKRLLCVSVLILSIFSIVLTHIHVQKHFMGSGDPRTGWERMTIYYKLAYRDLLVSLGESTQPVYFPLDLLNNEFMVAWLRTSALLETRPYVGEALPGGEVILATPRQYDIPDYPLPLQYGLILPGEIVVLPPLPMEAAEALAARVREDGAVVENARGVELGRALAVEADDNPFDAVRYEDGAALGVFDGRLELVDVVAPPEMTPGEWIPVTLYWRLTERTGIDYFASVQPVDANGEARGVTNGWIARSIYPTVMWQPGEVMAETWWLQVYGDAPPGGYRFLVGVYTQPGNRAVGAVDVNGVALERLTAGRAAIGLPEYIPPTDEALANDATLGGEIRLTHAQIAPEMLTPGATVNITLYWEAIATPAEDYTLFLHLTDASGNLVAQQDTPPLAAFPTGTWAQGDRFVTTHTLAIPTESSGPYALSAGLYRYPSLERLTVVMDGAGVEDGVVRLAG